MTTDFTLSRSRYGDKSLKASTEILLDEGKRRYLSIETSKSSRGGVSTTASVFHLTADGIGKVHAIGFGLPGKGDFWRTVLHDIKARCTEAKVTAMHKAALDQLDTIKQLAAAHYGTNETAPL